MLNKLALSGIKHRLRDYSVLFSGMIIASAIFYMFMSLATNKNFLKSNSPAEATSFIFGFGAVLLAIITIVYINYANSFLLSMRQKEYGMFMMLGAKSSKISKMIFIETFSIGAISTVIGSAIGILATGFVSKLVIQALDMQVKHFNSFYLPALLLTFAFFLVIFIFSALKNSISLRRSKVLTLLNKDNQPNKIKRNGVIKAVQGIIGIILIAIGYFCMFTIGKNAAFIMIGVPIALVTIVVGTYFTINSLVTAIISLLKRNTNYSQKGLNNFTLSQLSFRVADYTKILSMVSMMFALALGAVTVGIGFRNEITKVVDGQSYYDVAVTNINSAQQKRVDKLTEKENESTYSFKQEKGKTIYKQSEFKSKPYQYYEMNTKQLSYKQHSMTKVNENNSYYLSQFVLPKYQGIPTLVDDNEFDQIPGKINTITLVKTKSFTKNLPMIKQITKAEAKRFNLKDKMIPGKYTSYVLVNGVLSGLEFMGFFLGIAFLAMLASCLMFKILSGAQSDIKRYEMLYKMGTKQKTLRFAINKEIAVLFSVPAVLGIVHVLFGLQMFKGMLYKPYMDLEIPFGIFIVLYLCYYFITRKLYKQIVLKK